MQTERGSFAVIKVFYGQQISELSLERQATLLEMLRPRFPIAADCGGTGRCEKCKVDLVRDGVRKTVLACKEPARDGDEVYLPEMKKEESSFSIEGKAAWAAVDIGTTTVGYRVFNEKDELIKEGSFVNPEVRYGADVLSRIKAAGDGHLSEMQGVLVRKLNAVLGELNEVFVSANTVMLHIFAGISPSSMGSYPFTPQFTEDTKMQGKDCGLMADWVTLLPSADSFLGADAVCGATFLTGKNALLIDLGTNGEVVLKCGNRYLGASAPAGPALEGGNISCGMGSVDGAIYGVSETDGKLNFRVTGAPKGLGGTGLIDLIAILVQEKVLDAEGSFCSAPKWKNRLNENGFLLTNGIVLTQNDVRAFQLAKSAVRVTVEILLEKANLTPADLDEVLIAGSMGEGLNLHSAVRTGLLPKEFLPIARAVGNLSLQGAERAKTCGTEENKRIADRIERVELTAQSDFESRYIDYLNFPID